MGEANQRMLLYGPKEEPCGLDEAEQGVDGPAHSALGQHQLLLNLSTWGQFCPSECTSAAHDDWPGPLASVQLEDFTGPALHFTA